VSVVAKPINTFRVYNRERQVCVNEEKMKNLVKVETRQKQAAGATLDEQKGKIIDYVWWMKKQGYSETTIRTNTNDIKTLHYKGANLLDPESIKETIARQEKWSNSYKHKLVGVYTIFLKMLGRKWDPPKYKPVEKIPFIPTEKEIDEFIAGCGRKTSAYLQLLKETAMRSGEANKLKWTDVDFERGTVSVTPEKNSKPRILRLSKKCLAMLVHLKKTSDRIFGNVASNTRRCSFARSRAHLVKKLNNPRLRRIHFHTLRHWKATMLYHQTKDILYVKEFLGHRSINSTLVYIQLEQALFDKDADSFTCKVAKSPEEIKTLIESGFEYVTEKDGLIYFRKRK